MYKLYYSPGSCSLIIDTLLEELGVEFEMERVHTEAGEHRKPGYLAINPKGKVPALATPDGVLTECVALIEYLCDKHDGPSRLLGKPGTWQRAKIRERIATLATEIHPLFGRFFHEDDYAPDPQAQAAVKAHAATKLKAWFRAEDAALAGPYWSGDAMTAADIYFAVMVRWGRWLDPPATRMTNLEPFFRRMTERPAMARALEREGIVAFGAPA